ncbi:MAG: hypothetical protein AAFX81_06425 [Pseudomonadota bacterium]
MSNRRKFVLTRAFGAMIDRLVQRVPDVPPELEACEFHCRKADCCRGHWETCDRRLRYMNARRAHDAARSQP